MANAADAPVGILAEGWEGLRVADGLQRLLPHEDVVVLADHAYAP
jgi:glutamate racemase